MIDPDPDHANHGANDRANSNGNGDADAPEAGRPSKTRRKREMHALQDIGERLVGLSAARLASVELPERLRDAVELAQRIGSREGRRRQMQYIGRLMRDADAESIAAALERIDRPHRDTVRLDHAAERWRDRLLADESALTEFAGNHPPEDLQALRNTLRMARREHSGGQHGRHYRELYRVVRRTLAAGEAQAQAESNAAAGTETDRRTDAEPDATRHSED